MKPCEKCVHSRGYIKALEAKIAKLAKALDWYQQRETTDDNVARRALEGKS